MSTKPKLAYLVRCQEASVIVFATSGIAARRMGAAEMDADFDAVDSCCRNKHLDRFAEDGTGLEHELIENHGWAWECGHCYAHVNARTEERTYDAGLTPYCSAECCDMMVTTPA